MIRSLRTLALRGIAWFGFVAFAASPTWVAAQAVALVVDHTGQASIGPTGATHAMAMLATLAALPAGTRVQLQAGATLTVLYVATGDEYAVTGPGSVELGPTALTVADGATLQRHPPKTGKAVQLRADAVTMGGIVMRGTAPHPREPAGLLTVTPTTLVWDALVADAPYRIAVLDAAGAVLFEGRVQGLSTAFPAGVQLQPGAHYSWTVASDRDGATPASAAFEIASADQRDQAARLKPGEGAAFSERVAYALWLEQAGALGEARQRWQRLSEERPDDDALRARARR